MALCHMSPSAWLLLLHKDGGESAEGIWGQKSAFLKVTKSGQLFFPGKSAIFAGVCMCAKSLLSCLTLCYPMDCSPPGSSYNGISRQK